jgi:hypothetical protein
MLEEGEGDAHIEMKLLLLLWLLLLRASFSFLFSLCLRFFCSGALTHWGCVDKPPVSQQHVHQYLLLEP